MSLFLEAATFEELGWVIGQQMDYYNNERRHSRLGYRWPMECLVSEVFVPRTLAENGCQSGSASGAQVRVDYVQIAKFRQLPQPQWRSLSCANR